MYSLLPENQLIERILDHIDNKTTDLGTDVWREPTESYRSEQRFHDELAMMRQTPLPFCPSAMLGEKGSYHARTSAGSPILVVRGSDGVVRAFINACRHRGMQVADQSGCARAFVCPYHAWSYGLDGKLINIPGADGFPGVNKEEHGLIEISAIEKGGLIYIQQEGEISAESLAEIPDFFTPEQAYFGYEAQRDHCNWKLLAETTMEGYHIKGLHKNTFYPYGLDNTNVVETFGPHSRIVFPFKRINQLRDLPEQERNIDGMVTTVYNLFPNNVVSILSKHTSLSVFDPVSPTETRLLMYRVTNRPINGKEISLEEAERDAAFVKGTGLDEDRDAAFKIQQTVNSGKSPHLTFGLFEKAIVHFHQQLSTRLT